MAGPSSMICPLQLTTTTTTNNTGFTANVPLFGLFVCRKEVEEDPKLKGARAMAGKPDLIM